MYHYDTNKVKFCYVNIILFIFTTLLEIMSLYWSSSLTKEKDNE